MRDRWTGTRLLAQAAAFLAAVLTWLAPHAGHAGAWPQEPDHGQIINQVTYY